MEKENFELNKALTKYLDENHTKEECIGFIDGFKISETLFAKRIVVRQSEQFICDIEKGTRCKDSFPSYKDGKCHNCGGQAN